MEWEYVKRNQIDIIMRRFICFFMMLLALPMALLAQDGGADATGIVLDFSTYAGLAGIVGMIITQVGKLIPIIANNKWAKIGCSLVIGIIIAVIIKALGIESPVTDLNWGMCVLAGVVTGSMSCGIYDIIKGIIGLFKKNEADL